MKTLIIGCTCLDLIMNVDKLPTTQEDVNTSSSSIAMGGMAYNVYHVLEFLGCEAILAAPIGTGRFADLMMQFYKERNITPFARIEDMDNGICLCLVDGNGERTFISHHGAEYKFRKEWYKDVDLNTIDRIYVDGLEVEEDTGEALIEFLEESKREVFFAPGPRLTTIVGEKLNRILALKPILHINEIEAELFSGCSDYHLAAKQIYQITGNRVIITLGDKGAYIFDGIKEICVPSEKRQVVDTIGAGDCHAGAILACLQKGLSDQNSLAFANEVSGKVVEHRGAGVSKEAEEKLLKMFSAYKQ